MEMRCVVAAWGKKRVVGCFYICERYVANFARKYGTACGLLDSIAWQSIMGHYKCCHIQHHQTKPPAATNTRDAVTSSSLYRVL